jgi:hypothetical protein
MVLPVQQPKHIRSGPVASPRVRSLRPCMHYYGYSLYWRPRNWKSSPLGGYVRSVTKGRGRFSLLDHRLKLLASWEGEPIRDSDYGIVYQNIEPCNELQAVTFGKQESGRMACTCGSDNETGYSEVESAISHAVEKRGRKRRGRS